jgi:hypothetical protein
MISGFEPCTATAAAGGADCALTVSLPVIVRSKTNIRDNISAFDINNVRPELL